MPHYYIMLMLIFRIIRLPKDNFEKKHFMYELSLLIKQIRNLFKVSIIFKMP